MPTNFVFILADDLGYADLGCYGGRAPTSPNIDRMAAQGMRFTRGYANSAVCSPTRFALATGRYQYRIRGAAEEPIGSAMRGDKVIGLPPEHPTLASRLKEAGYRTALVGKWHLGFPPHFGPQMSGYDEHFGPLSGGVDYHTHQDSFGVHDLFENGTEVDRDGYLTDLLSERAAEFVSRCARKKEPFLLSLHYTAPHWPWETREDGELAKKFGKSYPIYHLDGGTIHIYHRMIHHMDEGIGKVLAALEAQGIADDTIVVFTSDNGGERFSDSWPLVGGKMDLMEGGIRVPYVVRWPRRTPAGAVTDQLAITMDWVPTFFEAAGTEARADYPSDGLSLVKVLGDPKAVTERSLYWRMKHNEQRAMVSGRWKYLKVNEHEYLFDVVTEERERANLAKRLPERLAEMRAEWQRWDATMPPIPAEAGVRLVYGKKDMP
ncbi:MAG TPA: sulfatase-like hydrolase/transferase [Reyranella sp.]|nr:sulfatase-like hydrolase/transferase [Reyranella sp.]